jgi:predicted nucleic-acid-binding protein
MLGLDTNVLLRYIVQDDARQAQTASRFIEHALSTAAPGFIGHIVLCEMTWVLESGYGYEREQIAATLQRVLETDRFQIERPALAWRALDAYHDGIDFADALIALIGDAEGCEHTVSFDRRAARYHKIRLLS